MIWCRNRCLKNFVTTEIQLWKECSCQISERCGDWRDFSTLFSTTTTKFFSAAATAAAAGFRKQKKLKKHDCERNKASIVNLNAVVKMKQNNLNID